MTRARLSDRRPSCTTQLVYEANIYSVTLGFDVARNEMGEVFTHGAKVGSGMDRFSTTCASRSRSCCSTARSPGRSPPAWGGSVTASRLPPSSGRLLI